MIHKTAPITEESPCSICGEASSAVLRGGVPVCRRHLNELSNDKGAVRTGKIRGSFEKMIGDAGEAMFAQK